MTNTTEITRVDRLVPAPQLPELPPLLTDVERREAFRLETVRVDGAALSRRVFIPPTAAERVDLERVQALLETRMAPCRRETIAVQLLRMAEHFPQHKDRKGGQWAAVTVDWLQDLAEFGDGEVRQAFDDHLRDESWFPKIAEIRKRCLEIQDLDRCRLRRVKVSLTGNEGAASPQESTEARRTGGQLPTVAEILAKHCRTIPAPAAAAPPEPINTGRAESTDTAEELVKKLAERTGTR